MPPRFLLATGDVNQILPKWGENRFDACFCDPPYGLSFMGKEWDHGVPSADCWSKVYRVLKPGGMLLAFGGTRTHHRLMCAIEDAGFEIRDCLMWLYGSGFPKSLDISKAIDNAAGAEREILGPAKYAARKVHSSHSPVLDKSSTWQNANPVDTAPATDAAKRWAGYGTALKPAWEPVILAMKPCEGTFAENALKWGVAGLSVDGCRISTGDKLGGGRLAGPTDMSSTCGGREWDRPWMHDDAKRSQYAELTAEKVAKAESAGRWPANLLLDEEAAAGMEWTRYFYCAKASRAERGEGNNHPTVKPLKLCEYLARLILPPARETPRRLLVPFAGSGSEMIGALMAGWDQVAGIEISPDYSRIAKARLGHYLQNFSALKSPGPGP